MKRTGQERLRQETWDAAKIAKVARSGFVCAFDFVAPTRFSLVVWGKQLT